ncbi:MAG: hypothetical protein KY475_04265 [Planctomycetes bacterium]|nr:hypothetical protein [Planctomycetota bacterium]
MSIVRIGSNEKYASHWDEVFGGKKGKSAAKKKTAKSPAKPAKAKTSAKKKAAKKKK